MQKGYLLLALLLASVALDVSAKQTLGLRASTSPYSKPEFRFLLSRFYDGMPHSYDVPDSFWVSESYLPTSKHAGALESQVAIQDRTCTKYGLNMYDGATWEIALALSGEFELADAYEHEVLFASSTGKDSSIGGLKNLRAVSDDFKYGAAQIPGSALPLILLPANATNPDNDDSKYMPGGFFYRMISTDYLLHDPLLGRYARSFIYKDDPQHPTTSGPTWNKHGAIIWNDWKPITGENVWAAIIGPLQKEMLKGNGSLPLFNSIETAPESVKMALSVVPALVALQSPAGALYHAPEGARLWPEDPDEGKSVSNENNFSAYASLKMLQYVLKNNTIGGGDGFLQTYSKNVDDLIAGLDRWWKIGGLSEKLDNGARVFYQGGHVDFSGQIFPAKIDNTSDSGGFAVDCQTWGMAVLGAEYIDTVLAEPGTAYNIWQETKARGGYFLDAERTQLGGVGFTNHGEHDIWSAEWTFGAILMTRALAKQYADMGQHQYADSLRADSIAMQKAVKQLTADGGMKTANGGYLYANKEFFIPWGWYAHSVPSTCATAWAIMDDFEFNPFILGGGLYKL